ncbi:phage holin [Enterococcus sp. BWR-S5]|uniref:phage holin n=1 Tax=Enterococcus sp. BWR-S5 TaxID=2787714 RepID=UPI0019220F70|nr:phage holin [Enterococcus sp. BWR-S5]MBL1226536.1 phage holin [Enterococcus sp. BWR-S5]
MNTISADTMARTIILVLALLNQVLAILGKGTINIAENDLYQVVSLLFTIGSTVVAWWKNNSFTTAAIEADERLKELKKDGE